MIKINYSQIRNLKQNAAYSIAELLVVVSILGIFSSITIAFSLEEIRKSQINAAAVQTAGWLEAVQRAAQRGQGCYVTVNNLTGASELSTIATSSLDTAGGSSSTSIVNHCSGIGNLQFETGSSSVRYNVAVTPVSNFVFTPRGSIFNPSSTSSAGTFTGTPQIKINISSADGSSLQPSKCIRILAPFGSSEVINC